MERKVGVSMDNSRIIMVDGNRSGWYEKAIFILTDPAMKDSVSDDMVYEAERIVEEYLKKQLRNEVHNKDYKVKQKETVHTKATSNIKTLKIISIISIVLCIISLLSYLF